MKVIKRDGTIVNFDSKKIYNAIEKAMVEVNGTYDSEVINKIVEGVCKNIKNGTTKSTVESIQDEVELALMASGELKVARAYILYREERNKQRNKEWEMNDLQRDIYEQKYRFENESFSQFLDRVSGGNKFIRKAIQDKEFIPAGRILAGRGLDKVGRKVTLSNCYVMPKVKDNIESIFDTAKYLARTYSYGGGVGINISNLRPKGARVNNSAEYTTGAVSFMDLFSLVTGLIGMRGRRGALMLNIDSNHPDIEEFIDVKSDLSKVTYANISVNIDDKFMEAVEKDGDYELYFKVKATGEEIKKTVSARELFYKLAKNNWDNAEPGILYTDRINTWHLMSEDKEFEFAGVNPCAEETLPAFGSCNLSSINLSELVINPFTKHARFDFNKFKELTRNGVDYLNEILDENIKLHPLKQQRDVSRDYRQIGLGLMGIGNLFIQLGIKYGDKESLELSDKIGFVFANEAIKRSAELAKRDGAFPKINKEAILQSSYLKANTTKEVFELVKKYGLRNSQILTIAPTGSISTLIGCSNGIEPIFQISYTRKTESLHNKDTYYEVFTPVIKELMDKQGITKVEELPDYIITSDKLDYKKRIDMQSVWQRHIDASISSTVNVPNEFTVEQVKDLYSYAWKKGLKGVTIYRDGCARAGILISDDSKEKLSKTKVEAEVGITDKETCPICEGVMIHTGGCDECLDCGYSPCSI